MLFSRHIVPVLTSHEPRCVSSSSGGCGVLLLPPTKGWGVGGRVAEEVVSLGLLLAVGRVWRGFEGFEGGFEGFREQGRVKERDREMEVWLVDWNNK